MSTIKYMIDNDCVIREDEGMLFDSSKYVIHQFNETAMDILKKLVNNPLSVEQLTLECPNILFQDIDEFIKSALTAGFIRESM